MVRFILKDLLVKPAHNLFTAFNPFVPVPPNEWTILTLLAQKLNAFVELAHALSNLDRSLGNA